MTAPDSPEFDHGLDVNWQVPATLKPLEELIERNLSESITTLECELFRVEALGCNSSKLAYHETYFSDAMKSGKRTLLFRHYDPRDSEDLFHVIVNDESMENQDHHMLTIREYVIAPFSSRIARTYSNLIKGHYEHSWQPTNATGPILRRYGNTLNVDTYTQIPLLYDPLLNSLPIDRLLSQMDQRLVANELTAILGDLNTVSLEPGITIRYT